MEEDLGELRDRAELGDLVAAYARGVDRKDVAAITDLFTEDGVLVARAGGSDASTERRGRDQIASAMGRLGRYLLTAHHLGQQWVELHGDTASGETYCLAHHLVEAPDGSRHNMVMSIRYLDSYVRSADRWRFGERRLEVDWTEWRPLGERPAGLGGER